MLDKGSAIEAQDTTYLFKSMDTFNKGHFHTYKLLIPWQIVSTGTLCWVAAKWDCTYSICLCLHASTIVLNECRRKAHHSGRILFPGLAANERSESCSGRQENGNSTVPGVHGYSHSHAKCCLGRQATVYARRVGTNFCRKNRTLLSRHWSANDAMHRSYSRRQFPRAQLENCRFHGSHDFAAQTFPGSGSRWWKLSIGKPTGTCIFTGWPS
mgnify:CR=1 FL=1